jgi:tRNA(fMet)-specific endonuclease VapC
MPLSNAAVAESRDFDAAIAAHALASGATLVTANLDHMARVPGLQIEDWSQ